MPSINMIAPRRVEKLRLERDMRRLVFVILAELVFAIALGGWACTKLFTTRNRIADMDVQIAKLQPVVKEIERYRIASEQLKPKLDLLGQAKDRTMRWYTTLDELTRSMPASTYLTQITTRAPDAQNPNSTVVNLNGVSVSQARVGETMMRLHNVPDFTEVTLHYTQNATVGFLSAIEFEIGADMTQGESPGGVKQNGPSQS